METAKFKWKSLRDTFRKKKKEYEAKCRSGAGATPEPAWLWYKHMLWLMPHLSRPITTSSLHDITQSDSQPSSDAISQEPQPTTSSTSPPANSQPATPPSIPTTPVPPDPALSTSTITAKKKRKRPRIDDNFSTEIEKELLKELKTKDVSDDCDLFGEEVAQGLRAISDTYGRELAKRKIRDIVFESRFNVSVSVPPQTPQTPAGPRYSAAATRPEAEPVYNSEHILEYHQL